jgi:hypothetical protein
MGRKEKRKKRRRKVKVKKEEADRIGLFYIFKKVCAPINVTIIVGLHSKR